MKRIDELKFDNSYSRLPQGFGTTLLPTPIPHPYLVSFNPHSASLIDLDPNEVYSPNFVEYFSGNRKIPGSQPMAMVYSGHQFGVYVPQLGDGRAILLGEVINQRGERWDLQLKGTGPTPYSRFGDGRSVLRSTIREFLCGEAMHGLGIPSTRALSIVGSDLKVYREMVETSAVLLRLALSHVRFGTFEFYYYSEQRDHIQTLADYVIHRHFPELAGQTHQYLEFFKEVVARTAQMIAKWQAVGFSHGVMNTDNMSILGETFDYGPFGFMESYNPSFICNHSDHEGRYAFDQQAQIGFWNLSRLGQALVPLIPVDEVKEVLDNYETTFWNHYQTLMRNKLGLKEAREGDSSLINGFLQILQWNQMDYTMGFRTLGKFRMKPEDRKVIFFNGLKNQMIFDDWANRYRTRLKEEGSRDDERKARMDGVNPKYILRNYLAQQAITLAIEERDFTEVDRLLELLRDPFSEQSPMERYAFLPPHWAENIQVSCSS